MVWYQCVCWPSDGISMWGSGGCHMEFSPALARKGSSALWPECLHMDEKEESVSIAMGGLCAMKLKHQKVISCVSCVEGLCPAHKQIKTGCIFSPGTPDLWYWGFCSPVQEVLHHGTPVNQGSGLCLLLWRCIIQVILHLESAWDPLLHLQLKDEVQRWKQFWEAGSRGQLVNEKG